MGHNLTIIDDSKMIIDGIEHSVDKCLCCGCSTVYIHYRGGKYQIKCWWDTTCKNRSGWHNTVSEALRAWNSH